MKDLTPRNQLTAIHRSDCECYTCEKGTTVPIDKASDDHIARMIQGKLEDSDIPGDTYVTVDQASGEAGYVGYAVVSVTYDSEFTDNLTAADFLVRGIKYPDIDSLEDLRRPEVELDDDYSDFLFNY